MAQHNSGVPAQHLCRHSEAAQRAQHAKAHAVEGQGGRADGHRSQDLNPKLIAGAAVEDAPVYQRGGYAAATPALVAKIFTDTIPLHGRQDSASAVLCNCHKGVPTAVSPTSQYDTQLP